jgi:menaquinone-9 beta-reductase
MLDNAPSSCDVLVVGAGPAGSACAQQLARAGFAVVLCDQHEFPRDKVCGDGLIPDAHVAMSRLGVYQEVMETAYRASHVGCVGPSGERVNVPGKLSVLQREVFDDILRRAALKAGARWLPLAKFEQPLFDAQDRVMGGRLLVQGQHHDVQAKWVVLATGAVPQALMAAGVCDRRTPSGIALRGYISNPAMVGKITTMDVVWHKALSTGYGWIFPLPGGVFNIGVGLAHSHEAKGADGREGMVDANLRDMFNRFCDVHAPARQLVSTGMALGGLKGAPLRCSLEGAKFSRPGLLVTGEAAGSTYAFTGEGIGKAMETGILAAETIAEARDTLLTEPQARAKYEAALLELKPRFDLYERANAVNKYPWLMDLTIRRANKSPRILKRMAAVLEEKGNPGNLVSLRGVLRLFVPIP